MSQRIPAFPNLKLVFISFRPFSRVIGSFRLPDLFALSNRVPLTVPKLLSRSSRSIEFMLSRWHSSVGLALFAFSCPSPSPPPHPTMTNQGDGGQRSPFLSLTYQQQQQRLLLSNSNQRRQQPKKKVRQQQQTQPRTVLTL